MGIFDTVLIQEKLFKKLNLFCDGCGEKFKNFQTKDLNPSMNEYFLCEDKDEKVRLKFLDPPLNEFFVEYSNEEIISSENEAREKGGIYNFWVKKKGDGFYKPEGFLPENRKQRHLGEFPHGFVSLTEICSKCKKFHKIEAKFTDGILIQLKKDKES